MNKILFIRLVYLIYALVTIQFPVAVVREIMIFFPNLRNIRRKEIMHA